MKLIPTVLFRSSAVALCLASAVLLTNCNRSHGRVLEVAYVSGVQANLRDHVAAVYEKAGVVKNGERVEVLDRDRHFVKVRTSTGVTGWMEQRYLASQDVFDQIQKLTADNQNDPVQAQGVTRNDTNLHVEPGRDTEHLYQILSGEKLALLRRGTAEKPGAVAPPSRSAARAASRNSAPHAAAGVSDSKLQDKKQTALSSSVPPSSVPVTSTSTTTTTAPEVAVPAGPITNPNAVMEDWWLVRDSHNRVGWVLSRMIDVDVPLDIAQYAEGQRIVAFFILDQVQDGDKKVPQYLSVLGEPKDGLPFDFNQIRVFTWNVRHHRYETAYRERVEGVLPVTLSQENFDKEGTLPVFVIRTKDDSGKIIEHKYKFNTPMVRRVLAPGEEPMRRVSRKPASRKTGRRR